MKTGKTFLETLTNIFLWLALAASIISVGGCVQAPQTKVSTNGDDVSVTPSAFHIDLPTDIPPAAAFTRILVSFKLDPRLTGGTYGGEVWVSPATYTGATAQDTVEAKAQGIDANGQTVPIIPEWTPADPEMVTVSPTQGQQVKITVHRAGESRLQVTSQGMSKTLSIKATYQNNVMQVEISQ